MIKWILRKTKDQQMYYAGQVLYETSTFKV